MSSTAGCHRIAGEQYDCFFWNRQDRDQRQSGCRHSRGWNNGDDVRSSNKSYLYYGTCITIDLGAGNPRGGYPDKATLYDFDSQIGDFNCIYLGPGPSGDPSQDATVIPEP